MEGEGRSSTDKDRFFFFFFFLMGRVLFLTKKEALRISHSWTKATQRKLELHGARYEPITTTVEKVHQIVYVY